MLQKVLTYHKRDNILLKYLFLFFDLKFIYLYNFKSLSSVDSYINEIILTIFNNIFNVKKILQEF